MVVSRADVLRGRGKNPPRTSAHKTIQMAILNICDCVLYLQISLHGETTRTLERQRYVGECCKREALMPTSYCRRLRRNTSRNYCLPTPPGTAIYNVHVHDWTIYKSSGPSYAAKLDCTYTPCRYFNLHSLYSNCLVTCKSCQLNTSQLTYMYIYARTSSYSIAVLCSP